MRVFYFKFRKTKKKQQKSDGNDFDPLNPSRVSRVFFGVFFALCLPFDFSSKKVIRREDNPIFPSLDLGLQYLSSYKSSNSTPLFFDLKSITN